MEDLLPKQLRRSGRHAASRAAVGAGRRGKREEEEGVILDIEEGAGVGEIRAPVVKQTPRKGRRKGVPVKIEKSGGKRVRRGSKVGSGEEEAASPKGSNQRGMKRRKKNDGNMEPVLGKEEEANKGAEVKPKTRGDLGQIRLQVEEIISGENPLLNEKILKKLFDLYPPTYKDLLNIRLTCLSWHAVTLPAWRSSAVLKLVPENTVFRDTENGGIKPTDLLSLVSDPSNPSQLQTLPFSKYKFNGLKLDMSIRNQGLSLQFWKAVGPHVKYLHLNKCEFIEVSPKPFECLVLEKTPKLQEIVISDTGMVEQPYGPQSSTVDLKKKHNLNVARLTVQGGIPLKLADLLKLFPNIKELTLRNGAHAKYSSSVITLLNNLRRDSRYKKYKLEKLDIKGTYIINNSIINPFMGPVSERWTQLRCNLKVLCLELTPLERADSIFQPLLQANKDVKSLELCIVPRYPTNIYQGSDRFQFRATMESLTDLKLWGNAIQNFKFLRFLPNLKRLYCNPLCFEKWTGRGKHHQPCNKDLVKNTRLGGPFTLNFMETLHVDHELSTMCVKKLAEWMPNLKVLETITNSQTLPLVVTGWPKLKVLRLLFGSFLDNQGVTGIGLPQKTGKRKKKGQECSLKDLKDLNVFTLDSYCNDALLSDESVHQGFLKMGTLMSLKMCVSDTLSPEAEAALKEKVPRVHLIRNGGCGPHPGYHCCIRKRFLQRSNATGEEAERLDGEIFHGNPVSDEESDDEDDEDDNHEFMSDSDDDVNPGGEEGQGGQGHRHVGFPPMPAFLPVLFAFQQIVGGAGEGRGAGHGPRMP